MTLTQDYSLYGKLDIIVSQLTGGTDCTTALQGAFTSAKNSGKPLIILASDNGLPYLCTSILRLWAGARVISYGATIDFQTDHSATGIGLFIGSEIDGTGISDAQVFGLKCISSNANARNGVYGLISIFNSAKVKLEDCEIGNSTAGTGGESTGIFAMNSSELKLIRPRINNTFADGIHLSRATVDSVVDHPVIIGAQDDGIGIVSNKQDGSGPIYAPCSRNQIIQPVVRNSTVIGNGIALVGAQDCTVIGGTVNTVPTSGIVVAQANYGGIINPSGNTITGTRIVNAASTSGSLRIGNATDTNISNVSISGGYAGATVVSSANTIFSGCRISSTGASQYGIYDDTASSRTIVTGCILIGNSLGALNLTGTGSTAPAGTNITA